MQFPELFAEAKRPVISFEVFPPKTDTAMQTLRAALVELAALGPRFMTVTYGAFGSTQERTLDIATIIRRELGLETACHLTCVGSSRADLDRILHKIAEAGIENIVALRGDPPRGQAEFVPPADGYAHANELVDHIRKFHSSPSAGAPFPGFGIAVAGYPEKHLEAPDEATDLANLLRKVRAGADIVITQLFYDNADFFRFVDAARAVGIAQPIVPGLLPIQSLKQIRRITSLCGSKIPQSLAVELEAAGNDDDVAQQIGIRQCVEQAKQLLAAGVPGIHFYVLNQSRHMQSIMSELRRAGFDI